VQCSSCLVPQSMFSRICSELKIPSIIFVQKVLVNPQISHDHKSFILLGMFFLEEK